MHVVLSSLNCKPLNLSQGQEEGEGHLLKGVGLINFSQVLVIYDHFS